MYKFHLNHRILTLGKMAAKLLFGGHFTCFTRYTSCSCTLEKEEKRKKKEKFITLPFLFSEFMISTTVNVSWGSVIDPRS